MSRVAEIDVGAFRHNLAVLKEQAGKRRLLMCLKANAYGHEVETLLPHLSKEDKCWVATLDEGIRLRHLGYEGGIVINTTPCSPQMLEACQEHDLEWVLFSASHVQMLEAFATNRLLKVWVKCNTGMHRLGVCHQDMTQVIAALEALSFVKIEGIVSHLANAGEVDHPLNVLQRKRFSNLAKTWPDLATSLYNSSGLLLHKSGFRDDWVRPGLALYGASSITGKNGADFDLKPVMTLKGQVIVVNKVQAGEFVGYDSSCQAKEDSSIAVVAMGYGDGYPRYAPNGTPVVIDGKVYPLAGRVSMDVITVDVGASSGIKVGDWAILWGKGLPVETIAAWANTTVHALLVQVGGRVKRLSVGV